MIFTYTSVQSGCLKVIKGEKLDAIRQHLLVWLPQPRFDLGDLQDALVAFRWKGHRLLIHQLAPIFSWVAQHGRVWNEDEEP